MEFQREQNTLLTSLTCEALGKVAHIESMVAIVEPQAEKLLEDVTTIAANVVE